MKFLFSFTCWAADKIRPSSLPGRRAGIFPSWPSASALQSLNVATGGTLIQDIPTEVYGQKTVEEVLAAGPDQVHSGVYLEKLYPERRRN